MADNIKNKDMEIKTIPQIFDSLDINKYNHIEPSLNLNQKNEDENIIINNLAKDFNKENINDFNLINNSMKAKITSSDSQEKNKDDHFAEVILLSKTKSAINQTQNNEIDNKTEKINLDFNLENKNKNTNINIPEPFNSSNINNLGSFILSKPDKNDKNEFEKRDLNIPEINNFTETYTNITNVPGVLEIQDLKNSNQLGAITKLDADQNPEIFDYSNINSIKNITFSNKKEDIDFCSKDYDTFNIYNTKEEINKKKDDIGKDDLNDSPEIFDSLNINNLKQPTTTLPKMEENYPQHFNSSNILNQIENISSTNINSKNINYMGNEIINSKDLPEIFDYSDINKIIETKNKQKEYNVDINFTDNNFELYDSLDVNILNGKSNSSKTIKDNFNNNLNLTPNIETKKIEENNIIKDFKQYLQNLTIDKNNLMIINKIKNY